MGEDISNHELKPTNFGIGKHNPNDIRATSGNPTPDQFGQSYNNDYDRSKWSSKTPENSRRDHDRSDVDTSPRALHHTLGSRRGQASPGDHIHDGTTSKKIGPLEMDPTPGNEGKTRPVLTIPVAATVADIVALLHEFVEFREV